MRAAEHAPRDPLRVLERRHGLADIVERGGGVLVILSCKAPSGPRGDQSRLLVSPERRRRGDSEDHADSPEHVVTTRDGLTLL